MYYPVSEISFKDGLWLTLTKVINEAVEMEQIMNSDEWFDSSEYQLLIRVLKEQSEDGKPKDKKRYQVQ